MLEAGETLQGRLVGSKFRLGRYLGGSERSAVFLTERLRGTPRTAAIKLIAADPETADLQLSRWRLISRLSHPHVLQIFEAGRCRQDGQEVLYVVMEYAEETLAQILPQRVLTSQEAHELLKPTLEALAYLHGRGFVHGHLKPANILVAGDQLKLSSDGICRIGELDGADSGIYGPPDLPGTAAAPPRDIWSLGVTLVHALTQLLPVRNGNEDQGVTLPETLPAQFVDLARRCLEPDPQRRCTLAEIAEQLHYKLPVRTLGPPPLPAEPIMVQRQAPAWPPRPAKTSQSALLAVAIIVALAAIVGSVTFLNRRPSRPKMSAVVQPVSAVAPERPPRIEDMPPAAAPPKLQPPERATLKTASEIGSVPSASSLKPHDNSSSGALVPGDVVQQVLPDVPRGASSTIRGSVRVTVRVRVDPAGNIAGVSLISSGPSRYFARLATDAARQWKFSPARRGGQAAASAWNVRFEFSRGGSRAIPVPVP
jgi:TonB family protein